MQVNTHTFLNVTECDLILSFFRKYRQKSGGQRQQAVLVAYVLLGRKNFKIKACKMETDNPSEYKLLVAGAGSVKWRSWS